MNNFQPRQQYMVKQQHSEAFTLRSIDSSEEMLEMMPVYKNDKPLTDFKSGHWSAKQHIKYVMFLDYFSDIFSVKHNIKLWKIFTIMQSFIKTRNSSQCRSHHQKTQRKLHSVQQILRTQRAKYRNYDIQFQKMKEILRKLPIHNPAQVQKQKLSSVQYIPSLKILQESIEYPVHRNSISLVDIKISPKSQKEYEDARSECIIHYPREKYIASEVSIEMQEESEELFQQKMKLLMYQQNEVDHQKEKAPWLFAESFGENSYRKDQKFDRTADSLFNDGLNKSISQEKSQKKAKVSSVPEKQSENLQKDQIPTDQALKSSVNLVRKKRSRTRSSLPSYDFVQAGGVKANPSQFRRQFQKSQMQTHEGKCKTLPPRSIKAQNEDSWLSQKIQNNEPVIKSLFFGFVSSLQSKNNDFEGNQEAFGQEQFPSFDNFCQEKQLQNDQELQQIDQMRRSQSEIENNETKKNLLFCEDDAKGNFYNQVQEGESVNDEDSIQFFPRECLKVKEKSQNYSLERQNESMRNFTKKKSQQVEIIHRQERNQNPQPPDLNYQSLNQASYIGFQPYCDNSQYSVGFQSFYNLFQYSHQQYPLLQYNYQQIVESYIYFLILKIRISNMYFDPN